MVGSRPILPLYLHLARASEQRRRPFVRDKLLLLAGAQAVDLGLEQIADYCRHKILQHNPGHLLRRFPTLAAARHDENFLGQLQQIQRAYPREKVEHMLDSLGIQLGRERDAYFTDHEYAASLLGTTPEELETLFGGQSAEVSDEALAEPVGSTENPYQSPADADDGEKTGDQNWAARRFPLPVGIIVLLSLGIPVLIGIALTLLLPFFRLIFGAR